MIGDTEIPRNTVVSASALGLLVLERKVLEDIDADLLAWDFKGARTKLRRTLES